MNKVIILLCSLVLLAMGGRFLFLNIGDWLVLSEDPGKADIIICLNGDKERIPRAAELFKQGYADKILVTYPKTGKLMQAQGVPEEAILSLHSRPTSTYEEALGALRLMAGDKIHSALIVCDPYQLRRAKWTFSHQADNKTSISYAAYEALWAKGFWWDNTKSRLAVFLEIPKLVYYLLGHGVLGVRHDPQWVIETERWYNHMLRRFV